MFFKVFHPVILQEEGSTVDGAFSSILLKIQISELLYLNVMPFLVNNLLDMYHIGNIKSIYKCGLRGSVCLSVQRYSEITAERISAIYGSFDR